MDTTSIAFICLLLLWIYAFFKSLFKADEEEGLYWLGLLVVDTVILLVWF